VRVHERDRQHRLVRDVDERENVPETNNRRNTRSRMIAPNVGGASGAYFPRFGMSRHASRNGTQPKRRRRRRSESSSIRGGAGRRGPNRGHDRAAEEPERELDVRRA
jgi:hypothetical protein